MRIRSNLVWLLLIIITGCTAPQRTQGVITVQVSADTKTQAVVVPAGSSAAEAFTAAGIVVGSMDRADPPFYTLLQEGSKIKLIRVREEFSTEQVVLAFEAQVLRNESLPEGQEYFLQLGQNGLQEITTRRVYEDGVEVSSSQVSVVVIKSAIDQIKMIGVQKPFAPFPIPGKLVYIQDGNAWIMETTTANRRQVVTTGDLDGRVFSMSPDKNWLLFTRRSMIKDIINTLWVQSLSDMTLMIDLKISNVVNFAGWSPKAANTVYFTTVEPRASAPGWQANNDLNSIHFSSIGTIDPVKNYIEVNQGGVYGWWGTTFSFSYNDELKLLAYARPDGIGLVNLSSNELSSLLDVTPLQTFGDWAWVAGLSWGADGKIIYTVNHLPPAESTRVDLVAILKDPLMMMTLVKDVGLYPYPVASPAKILSTGEVAYQVAYLQSEFPEQGENSPYRLMIIDRDGSNRRLLFPKEGTGLKPPQRVVWSPKIMPDRNNLAIAVLYQNNLWFVDAVTGEARQVTGDGLTSFIDWK